MQIVDGRDDRKKLIVFFYIAFSLCLSVFLCTFLKNFSLHTVKTPDFFSISERENKFSYLDSEEQKYFLFKGCKMPAPDLDK